VQISLRTASADVGWSDVGRITGLATARTRSPNLPAVMRGPSRARRVGATRAGAEFGGSEFHPDLARKTAVLASRLIATIRCRTTTSGLAICARSSSSSATAGRGPTHVTTRRVTKPSPSSKVSLPAASARTSSPR